MNTSIRELPDREGFLGGKLTANYDSKQAASDVYTFTTPDNKSYEIKFQNGPLKEVGNNGLTHEVLLTIIKDRLESFQSSKYECSENDEAIYHILKTLQWLDKRTENRRARGVEGTTEV